MLVKRLRRGAKTESWSIRVEGGEGVVKLPAGFGYEGLEVDEGDFRLRDGKVIHKLLVKPRVRVRGGGYEGKVFEYSEEGYHLAHGWLTEAVNKVWEGYSAKGFDCELEGRVKDKLVVCLMVHLGKRGFWGKRYDRKGKLINHRGLLVAVVRNYLIDLSRRLIRRGIPVDTRALFRVIEDRDGKVLVKRRTG